MTRYNICIETQKYSGRNEFVSLFENNTFSYNTILSVLICTCGRLRNWTLHLQSGTEKSNLFGSVKYCRGRFFGRRWVRCNLFIYTAICRSVCLRVALWICPAAPARVKMQFAYRWHQQGDVIETIAGEINAVAGNLRGSFRKPWSKKLFRSLIFWANRTQTVPNTWTSPRFSFCAN